MRRVSFASNHDIITPSRYERPTFGGLLKNQRQEITWK